MFDSLRPSERLIKAVIDNNYDDALQALNDGADVNIQRTKNTPLLFALSKQHFDIANLLVDRGADVNRDNGFGWLPLHEVAQQGNQEWVGKITSDPFAYRDRPERSGETPMLVALNNGHNDVALHLVEIGCDVNAQTDSGVSPFMLAVERQKSNLVEAMLQRKGDVNLADKAGRTALDRAENWPEGLKLLSGLKVEKSIAVNVEDSTAPEVKAEENTISGDGIRSIQKRRRPS